jgi:hypothetical protein
MQKLWEVSCIEAVPSVRENMFQLHGKNNNFSKVCRAKRKVGLVEQDKSKEHLEPLFIGAVNYSSSKSNNNDEDEYFKKLVMQDKQIQFKIDTGSQANILPVTTFRSLKDVQLETTAVKLTSYTGEHLPVLGQCYLKFNDNILKFFVVDTKQVPILGLQTSKDLNLIKLVMNVKLSKRENTTAKSVNDMASQFPKVFQGLGCLKKPYHIQVDPKVTPVVSTLKSQPVALRDRLKQSLDEMEADGVIEKVDQPTEWVNSVVVVEKPNSNKLRICLDPRPLNEAIQRERYKMPTIEEITTRVAGATVFSKLDANHGYWQVALDNESQLLTTFNTEFGRYCYKRLPFGIKSAQEVFQTRMSQSFGYLEGVETDVDDILVWGTTTEEHDQRLKKTLQRCEEINLTLNQSKFEFGTTEVVYIGHTLTAQGVKPDESKVDAINKMPCLLARKTQRDYWEWSTTLRNLSPTCLLLPTRLES